MIIVKCCRGLASRECTSKVVACLGFDRTDRGLQSQADSFEVDLPSSMSAGRSGG
jgi:hypothetical protein